MDAAKGGKAAPSEGKDKGASQKQPLLGGTKRHARFRNAKHGLRGGHIAPPSIRRLARRGGVKRIGGGVYEEARHSLEVYLAKVVHDLVRIVDHAGRFTVTVPDVLFALKRNGQALYGFGEAFPMTRAQRASKLRRPIRSTEAKASAAAGEGAAAPAAGPHADVTTLVQRALADLFMAERRDVCRVDEALACANGAIAAAGNPRAALSELELRGALQILQTHNRVMCSGADIYLI